MANLDEQTQIRAFVRDVVSSTITSRPQGANPSGPDFSLHRWIEDAIRRKIRRDLPEVNPQTEQWIPVPGSTDEYIDLYIPKARTIANVRTCTRNEARLWSLVETPATHAQQTVRHVREMIELGKEVDAAYTVYIPRDSNNIADLFVHSAFTGENISTGEAFSLQQLVGGTLESTINRPDARDLQVMPGPSNLSDPCDMCVARSIARPLDIPFPQVAQTFSLKAWVGTAAHEALEEDICSICPEVEREITVPIADIPGLGPIKGHVDAYFPSVVNDYKTTDLGKLEGYRTNGVPERHAGQVMLYMRGIRNSGRSADTTTLTYIPRDSDKISDIWVASCAYRGDIAEALLRRAKSLTEMVRSQQAQKLTSSPTCFVCSRETQLT
jgi:hypothetical protein